MNSGGVLLIIAIDFAEARRIAVENGLWPLPGRVRTIVKPEALRGWSPGTPALVGRMADWPDGDRVNNYCRAIEHARQGGHVRMATADDIESIKQERMAAA